VSVVVIVLNVTFHGVRGVAPDTASPRYGGYTACVAVEVPKRDPILFDLGTGFARWAVGFDRSRASRAHVLLSHGHPGHVAGRAVRRALDADGARIDVYGPKDDPPGSAGMARELRLIAVEDEELVVGDAKVTVRGVPHDGATNGYRVDMEGVSVAYVSDHRPPPGLDTVSQGVLELADHVDLLIHDAQLTTGEWPARAAEGHSTVDYAVLVAREAGARCLALFHHDPSRDDNDLDGLLVGARRAAERLGVDEVIAAAEGTTVAFDR